MDFRRYLSRLAPVLGAGLLLSACDKHTDISINGDTGKPLSEVDLTTAPAKAVVLFGPDTVRIHRGDRLTVTVEGGPAQVDLLRFTYQAGTLGILRRPGSNGAPLTIDVTMPAPEMLTMTGSGQIIADALASDATVVIGGSGNIDTPQVAAQKLSVNVAGSGHYRAHGTVGQLSMNIAGTGGADLPTLRADKAEVNIMGTGDVALASDGVVEGNIMGTGTLRVIGKATCKPNVMGTGKVVCQP
ncbi:DUF2807 domain-containing protein [Novosphingobium sp. FSY-8]|uniref:DUF2807 domain-containing protein n=1 Tax=Novosphingobium ovatum TaxID=1908523 RepID=A0ABW9XHM2_9SPHN|nr:head GIN domain-containing protein [Novosphingobium ovatum]NBC37958.1 DUF2807 domain-containing protein [Novosphingobium ovatum]